MNKNNGKLHGGRSMLVYKLQIQFHAILSVKLSRENKEEQGYLQYSSKLCHIVSARCPAFEGMTLPTGIVDPKLGGQSCELECDEGVRSSF
mmetsp:Transcript_47586/g.99574  ORF Transcript_47586/g.99574 Transcript_47586/m.99574 type:complete len:91 (-) Transcript_47586:126-398(-)